MPTIEFDQQFQDLCQQMVEIAFEFVNFNKKEVDTIYVFGSLEGNIIAYELIYRINGKLAEVHKLNVASKKKYDLSDARVISLLREGGKSLKEVRELFLQAKREVPTLLKMAYFPKTGKLNNDISYDLHYTNHKEWTAGDIFNQWVEELKKSDNQENMPNQDKGWLSKFFQF
ncbi:hypothetical protein EHQ24_05380 [Leptospira noumeaensis]|uniref:DUF600 family protein n=1 Tax=Leptospira noumeaensis TaxID=2484964 RepID=A0A4R9IFE5_9LEPT|nr:hypothetical protein [Leptospira noumeaensis]TGK87026.1 hypothetical protein EHQ24_05380 [Leptospira noumeaensis]